MPYAASKMGRMSWVPVTFLLFLLAVVGGGGYWYWQAREYSEGQEALKKRRYDQAIVHADKLIKFGPDKEKAKFLKVRALIKSDPPAALALIDEIAAANDISDKPDIALAYLKIKIDAKDTESLDADFEKLAGSFGGDSDYLILKARYQYQRGERIAAFTTLDRLMSIDPDNHQALLMLGKLLLSEELVPNTIQAKAHLRRAAEDRGHVGIEALRVIATHPAIPLFENDRRWLMSKLSSHPRATPEIELLAASNQLIIEPENREAIIAEKIRLNGPKNPELVIRWLYSIGAYQELQTFLQSSAASDLPEDQRMMTQLQTLFREGDLSGAGQFIDAQGANLSEARRATLRAFLDDQLNQSNAVSDSWQNAYNVAIEAQAFRELAALARLAMQNEWTDSSIMAFDAALKMVPDQEEKASLLNAYFIALVTAGRTTDALKVAKAYVDLKPNDLSMLNNMYYMEALLSDPIALDDPHRILPVIEQAPNSIFRSSYAFILWRAGEFDLAAEQFSKLNRKFLQVPSCRLGGALIALDRGNDQMATRLLESLDPEILLPEEAKYYRQAADRLKLN